MISDTLSEAVKDLDDDLTRFPETYGEYRSEILDVIEVMERLRSKLATMPRPDEEPCFVIRQRTHGWHAYEAENRMDDVCDETYEIVAGPLPRIKAAALAAKLDRESKPRSVAQVIWAIRECFSYRGCHVANLTRSGSILSVELEGENVVTVAIKPYDNPPEADNAAIGKLVRAAEDVVNLYEHPDSGHMGKAVRHLGEVLEPWLTKPCANCGTPHYHGFLDGHGLCDRCSEAAERSTSRSLHGSAGLGWEPR